MLDFVASGSGADMPRNVNVGSNREAAPVAPAKNRAEFARVTRLTTLGQALASIGHEIKQPLAAVVTNGNAALRWLRADTPNVAEAKQALERVVSNGHRIGETIQNIRAMLEPQTSETAAVDLNEVVRGTLALLDDELECHHVRLETDFADALPAVRIEREQLQQVVLNLVTNAVEAMEPIAGTARVLRVGSRLCDDEVLLSVEDCGTGIAPEIMGRIFSPFFTTKSHALGLGLTICRSVVEVQGGRVYAGAGSPHGTVLHVVLPPAEPESA